MFTLEYRRGLDLESAHIRDGYKEIGEGLSPKTATLRRWPESQQGTSGQQFIIICRPSHA
jgi:hypothetical protein